MSKSGHDHKHRAGPDRSGREGISLTELFRMFPDDAAAEAWFIRMRWPDCVVLQLQWREHPEPRCFLMSPDLAEDVMQSIEHALKAIAARPTSINWCDERTLKDGQRAAPSRPRFACSAADGSTDCRASARGTIVHLTGAPIGS